jgi:hypothetical protein
MLPAILNCIAIESMSNDIYRLYMKRHRASVVLGMLSKGEPLRITLLGSKYSL